MSNCSAVSLCKESIRVLVVEDHHVVRQGLVALLNVADGIEVVGEAADGVEAITQFRKHQPAITLIDSIRQRKPPCYWLGNHAEV